MATKSEKELVERDLKRDIWQETLDAVRDIKADKVGAVRQVPVSIAAEARHKLRLTCR